MQRNIIDTCIWETCNASLFVRPEAYLAVKFVHVEHT